MSLNVPVFIKDDTKSSEQTNLSNVPLHGMPLQGTTDNSSNLAWTPFNNTALGGVYSHHSGWDEYEPPEEWPNDIQPNDIQPDDVQDDDYEPPESFAATDNEIIKISDDDESQGNGDEYISTKKLSQKCVPPSAKQNRLGRSNTTMQTPESAESCSSSLITKVS
jgi:hypothetical protein